ncbi:uncharacterized protein LOC143022883 [Oratosquilla oratoria]|uniref:uncharacterized protein LOC143022883 n=1 Tax=Oratosquilla oratoria TaxID=337810 RepID=UPI003F760D5F
MKIIAVALTVSLVLSCLTVSTRAMPDPEALASPDPDPVATAEGSALFLPFFGGRRRFGGHHGFRGHHGFGGHRGFRNFGRGFHARPRHHHHHRGFGGHHHHHRGFLG